MPKHSWSIPYVERTYLRQWRNFWNAAQENTPETTIAHEEHRLGRTFVIDADDLTTAIKKLEAMFPGTVAIRESANKLH